MTSGMPESTVATSEFVVPKSMPTILFMLPARHRQHRALASEKDAERFSLSPRERAGVRGKSMVALRRARLSEQGFDDRPKDRVTLSHPSSHPNASTLSLPCCHDCRPLRTHFPVFIFASVRHFRRVARL